MAEKIGLWTATCPESRQPRPRHLTSPVKSASRAVERFLVGQRLHKDNGCGEGRSFSASKTSYLALASRRLATGLALASRSCEHCLYHDFRNCRSAYFMPQVEGLPAAYWRERWRSRLLLFGTRRAHQR